jgi:hypothetical protein
MKTSDIIASIGVTILLVAFFLNIIGKLSAKSKPYTLMNFIGAAMCGFSSYLIKFYPFVILESIWATVALVTLFKVPRGTQAEQE